VDWKGKVIWFAVLAVGMFACSDDESTQDLIHGHENHHHGSHSHGDGGSTDGGHEDLAGVDLGDTGARDDTKAHCACLLEHCHDLFHEIWGVDDGEAFAACNAETGALPVLGEAAESGDSFECRQGYCVKAMEDESHCEAAVGRSLCVGSS
jgi:hypothetical protein